MKIEPYIEGVSTQFGGTNEGISIIIPIHGKHFLNQLLTCIHYIRTQNLASYEIIIVEEDSKKSFSNLKLNKGYEKHLFMQSEQPFCKAKCFNYGISRARYSKICGLDCDMIIPPNFLRFGEIVLSDHDAAFPAGNIYYSDDYPDNKYEFKWNGNKWTEKAKFKFHGGCFFINKEKYEEIGGFNENFVGYGSEDTEFHNRVMDSCDKVYQGTYFSLLHMYHDEPHKKDKTIWNKNKFILNNLESKNIKTRVMRARSNNTFIETSKTVKLVDKGTLGKAKTIFNGGIDTLQSNNLKWEKISKPSDVEVNEFIVFTESAISEANKFTTKNKILVLTEPRVINQRLNNDQYIKGLLNIFRYIFTYDRELLKLSNQFISYRHGGTWISQNINEPKTKLCSFISSNKAQTGGHMFRHDINKLKCDFDRYGTITGKKLDQKFDALKDYKFSIVVENCVQRGYFTEKIIDCFRSRTIPIYWGDPDIKRYFSEKGIITFNNLNELKKILEKIDDSVYDNRYKYVLENEYLCRSYMFFEDQFYSWLIKSENENRT